MGIEKKNIVRVGLDSLIILIRNTNALETLDKVIRSIFERILQIVQMYSASINAGVYKVITPQQSWGLDGKEQSQRLLNCCKIDLKIKTHRFR